MQYYLFYARLCAEVFMSNNLREIKCEVRNSHTMYECGKKSIIELANLFAITLDENRKDDYDVSFIDFDIPSILIEDKGTDSFYEATYTDRAKMFNSNESGKTYIEVKEYAKQYVIESLYRAFDEKGTERFIASKATFKWYSQELFLLLEQDHSITFPGINGQKFTVGYETTLEKQKDKKDRLLTKTYNRYVDKKGVINSSEHLINVDPRYSIGNGDQVDVWFHSKDNGVTMGVNDITVKTEIGRLDVNLKGFCFENLSMYGWKELPLPYTLDLLNSETCPELFDGKTISAIYFKGCEINSEIKTRKGEKVRVFKRPNGIEVLFEVIRNGNGTKVINTNAWTLPVLAPGSITIEEIDSIVESLKRKTEEDKVMDYIIMQLLNFRKKICENKGLLENKDDALSPKTLLNLPFKEAVEMVASSEDSYFKLVDDQFARSINLRQELAEAGKSFKITPTGNNSIKN